MRHRHGSIATLSTLAFALALLVPAGGGVNAADDTALFSNQIPPNVMLVIDTSGSMNQVVWHPAYHPEREYDPIGCPVLPITDEDYDPRCLPHPLCNISYGESGFDGGADDTWRDTDLTFRTEHGRTGILKCGNTRDVWVDPEVEAEGNQTRWPVHYLQWYFSDNVEVDHDGDGRTILQETLDLDDGQTSQCVLDQDPSKPATYAKYKRARMTAAKQILRQVICETNAVATLRYGLAKFEAESDPEGGFIRVPIADYTASHANDLEAKIDELEGESWTPLGETIYNVYRYFQSRGSNEQALGKDGITRFPVYDLDVTGSTSGTVPGSPVTDDCQQHFIILITDGEPTKDTFDNLDPSQFEDDLVGDYNDFAWDSADETPANDFFAPAMDDTSCGGPFDCKVGLYLDDIAKFMRENDFQLDSSFPSTQVIDTYTVGFTTSPQANVLLAETARVGNGKAFFSNNAEELAPAIAEAIADIVAKSKAFTAATVPASRATDGNNFFTSYFTPSQDDPYWAGHLKLFDFNANGEILDAPSPTGTGQCALNDPQAPDRCRVGGLNLTLNGFWDAGKVIPAPSSRTLYVSQYQSGAPAASTLPVTPPSFDETTVTTDDLGVTGATNTDIAEYDNGVSGFDLTGIDTDTELKDAIVGYIRGCNFDNGSCTDRGEFKKLWDIFHSNPVVVGPPNAGLRERSYRDFVLEYKHRKRVIYAGSQGGFVHGFNAGEWDNTLTPPGYDRGTGVEEFGFMAYPARQTIAKRPKDIWPRGEDGWNGYNMDGSPTAADVWFYQDADDDPQDNDMGWEDWRTVLVGGMRQGGEVVWALDITDPDGETGEPTMYPGYLWEFPCENTACDAWRPYMGQTWSQPVVTRIRATIDCGDDADPTTWAVCPQYDRWVVIFGAGYDDSGDPNLTHDTDGTVAPGEYDPSNDSGTLKKGRAVFMVDIATGEVLAAKRYQHDGTSWASNGGSADGEPGMQFAVAAAPSVFDIDFDGYADVVYFGDLGGNLWKWVIEDPAQDHVNGTQGTDHQARWPLRKILAAQNCTTCSPKHYKSFFFPPTGALVGPNLYLALGSGERTDLDFGRDGGLSTEEKNRFYVFKDQDPLEIERDPANLPFTDASGTDFIDGTTITDFNPNSCLSSGNVGFYFEGDDGEKFITDSIIFFGVVFTGSYVPAPSTASVCEATGTAYLYAFDLLCGEGGFPPSSGDENDPKERRVSVGEGLPNSPRVSVGPTSSGSGDEDDDDDPCKDMVIVITSENGGFTDGRCERTNAGLGVQTWRDM